MPDNPNPIIEWLQYLSLGSNALIILVGYKAIRAMSRIEFKVETMWNVFIRRFGTRVEGREEKE